MGKGPLQIVSPKEWRSRTALTFGSRDSIVSVDDAYTAWYEFRNPKNAARLYEALEAYLVEKGGSWAKVKRNAESGGLMQFMHREARARAVGLGGMAAVPARPPALVRLQDHDIPHSRYGVLYLLGNTQINVDALTVTLEGVAAVGGAVASPFTTDMGHLDNAKAATRTVNMGALGPVSQQSLVSAGGLVIAKSQQIAGAPRTIASKLMPAQYPVKKTGVQPMEFGRAPPAPKIGVPEFPATKAMFELIKDDPVLMLNPFTLAGTVVGVTAIPVVEALNNLRKLIQDAVVYLYDYIRKKIRGLESSEWASAGSIVKSIIKLVVAKCLEAAAPLIGAGMDLGTGILKTVRAATARIGAMLERRQIIINPGHPELLANRIESQMNDDVLSGLWSVLKGVAAVALQSFLPGAGNLVNALVTGIEWMVKFISRLAEQARIDKFLKKARGFLEQERKLANATESLRGVRDAEGKVTLGTHTHLEPNMNPRRGGIIHDLAAFKTFYEEGCNASPLIPMLTLNSGICGSLMTLIQMFDDTSEAHVVDGKVFDAGNAYFTRLKEYGRNYLKSSGFKFDSGDKVVKGLLEHAVVHHGSNDGVLAKAAAFVSG